MDPSTDVNTTACVWSNDECAKQAAEMTLLSLPRQAPSVKCSLTCGKRYRIVVYVTVAFWGQSKAALALRSGESIDLVIRVLKCAPAELIWRAGVWILGVSIGQTIVDKDFKEPEVSARKYECKPMMNMVAYIL